MKAAPTMSTADPLAGPEPDAVPDAEGGVPTTDPVDVDVVAAVAAKVPVAVLAVVFTPAVVVGLPH